MLGPYKVVGRVKGTENTDLYILEDPQSGARLAPSNIDTLVPLDWYDQLLKEQEAELAPPKAESGSPVRKRLRRWDIDPLSPANLATRVGEFVVFRGVLW